MFTSSKQHAGFAPFTNISLTSPGSLGDVYVDDIDADGCSDLVDSILLMEISVQLFVVLEGIPSYFRECQPCLSNSSGMGGPGGSSTTISDILSVNLWVGSQDGGCSRGHGRLRLILEPSKLNQQGGFAWVISMINATDLEDNIQAVDIDGDGDDDLFGDAPMSGQVKVSVFTAAGGYRVMEVWVSSQTNPCSQTRMGLEQ